MRIPPLPSAVILALACGALDHAVASTTAVEPDLDQLVSRAEWICEVEVLAKECLRLADGEIETRYTLATILPMKGAMASVQQIRVPGGEIAGRGLVIPGLPQFEVGQRHILFLSAENARRQRMPVGLDAGAYLLRRDPVGGELQVQRMAPTATAGSDGAYRSSHDAFVQDILDRLR